jgi:aspartyl-tRNA(Asn)/glutamyl-tRNA(Gln) amidotransferase subunit C
VLETTITTKLATKQLNQERRLGQFPNSPPGCMAKEAFFPPTLFSVVGMPGCRYHNHISAPFPGGWEKPVATNTPAPEINVAYVANLARLDLDAASCATFQRQLGVIVDYVRQIGELDLEGIEPTSHGQPVYNVFREDVERAGLERERVLANAPARIGDEFKVPRIVE